MGTFSYDLWPGFKWTDINLRPHGMWYYSRTRSLELIHPLNITAAHILSGRLWQYACFFYQDSTYYIKSVIFMFMYSLCKVSSCHCAHIHFSEIVCLSTWSRMPYKQCLAACLDHSGVRPFLDVSRVTREFAVWLVFRQKHFTTSTQHSKARRPCKIFLRKQVICKCHLFLQPSCQNTCWQCTFCKKHWYFETLRCFMVQLYVPLCSILFRKNVVLIVWLG